MAKKEISGKQIGKNIIVVIDGVKHSKAIDNPEERKEILKKVKNYNTKNNATLLKDIITILTPIEKVKKDSLISKVHKVIKSKDKAKVIEKVKEEEKKIEKPATYQTKRRCGEY